MLYVLFSFLLFNDTPPTEIYTLSLPRRSSDLGAVSRSTMSVSVLTSATGSIGSTRPTISRIDREIVDRKSTRLNSSHRCISYAVFCLKKKKKKKNTKYTKLSQKTSLQRHAKLV